MSNPLASLTDSGAASLTEFDEDYRAARFLADRPLESADIPALTQRALDLATQRRLLLPDAKVLLERCVVALLSGHLVLQGPPGTGKTTLARLLAQAFNTDDPAVETATADWSTYDVIGGLQPTAGKHGEEALRPWLGHVPRAAVRCANVIAQQADSNYTETHQAHWLILDEFSRAEIDKAIGPLYTVLGGGERRLPLWFGDTDERREVWLPDRFRLIGTMNDVDTSYAYTFSQGLSRRFQFIYVGVPAPEQVRDEVRTAALQAGAWHARTYQGLTDQAGVDTAATTFADTPAVTAALEVLERMLQHLRYDSADPTRPDRPGWPVGTAQVVDALRQLALRTPYAGAEGLTGALDLALADRLIPQMSNLTAEQLNSYEEWFDKASLTRTRRALVHLRQAQTTNFS